MYSSRNTSRSSTCIIGDGDSPSCYRFLLLSLLLLSLKSSKLFFNRCVVVGGVVGAFVVGAECVVMVGTECVLVDGAE